MADINNYELTQEQQVQLREHAEEWAKNSFSTVPMTDDDREKMREAVRGMYRASGLEPPPDHRIIFTSSPFIA